MARPLAWVALADDQGVGRALKQVEAGGPPFLAALTSAHRRHLDDRWPHRQWVAFDGDEPVASVRAVDTSWDGTTAGAPGNGLGTLIGTVDPATPADTLAVVDITAHPSRRGTGSGALVLGQLTGLQEGAGHDRLLVLVRPHGKRRHPLVPFTRYLAAADDQGRPRDGWLAAAWTSGLHPVRAVDRSLVARAPLAAWREWYGRDFPTSGPYLIEGAIKPAIIEYERDEGRYREPHLWMAPQRHLAQRTVSAEALRQPRDAWRRALAAAGIVPGSRRHREVYRER